MTMIVGCDYSFSRPSMATLKHLGVRFAARYYSTPGNAKNLSRTEAVSLIGSNIDIVSVYETTGREALGGFHAGHDAALSAAVQADLMQQPHDTAIYYAVDFDASSAQRSVVSQYFNGIRSAGSPFRIGVYGSYYVCSDQKQKQASIYTWQTAAWSGGQQLGGVDIYQPAEHFPNYPDIDRDYAYGSDFGSWHGSTRPDSPWRSDVNVDTEMWMPGRAPVLALEKRPYPSTTQPTTVDMRKVPADRCAGPATGITQDWADFIHDLMHAIPFNGTGSWADHFGLVPGIAYGSRHYDALLAWGKLHGGVHPGGNAGDWANLWAKLLGQVHV